MFVGEPVCFVSRTRASVYVHERGRIEEGRGGEGREVTGRFSCDPSRICLGTWKKRGLEEVE